MLKKFSVIMFALLMGVSGILAQDAQTRNLTSGQKIQNQRCGSFQGRQQFHGS